ncbi:MAG TPA: hypothetical protein VGD17_02005 [Chitinophagaceae bacterium]
MKSKLLSAVIIAALVAGSLDIILAFTNAYVSRGTTPDKVLKYIASGVFGKQAFSGGSGMIASGLGFHYLIAFLFTLFYFLAYPVFIQLTRNKFVLGILYGIFIWSFMHFVVLPISRTPGPAAFKLSNAALAAGILVIAMGIPLAFFAHRYYSARQTAVS